MRAFALIAAVCLAGCPSDETVDAADLAMITADDGGEPSDTGVVADMAPQERPRELLTLGTMPDGAADDDPMVISHEGQLWLAFLSDRAGGADVWVSTTQDGDWADPVQVSEHPDDEWYPTMRRDADGVFHIVWTRVQGAPDFFRHIIYNRSEDGLTWEPATEVNVTDGVTDDSFGHLVADGSTLRVYFASQVRGTNGSTDLFVTSSTDGGDTWSAPAELTSLSSAATELFAWVENTPDGWVMAFVRSDAADANNYLAPSTEIWLSTSTDGLAWDAPLRVTDNDAVDSLPSVFVDTATGEASMFWISTHTADGEPIDVRLDVDRADDYPTSRVDLTARKGVEGWSPRVAATSEPGLNFLVSVAHDTGVPRLYTNWFRP